MRLFTNDGELIAIGASYLRFMSVSYLCWGITEVYLAVLRSIGRVTISTLMNVLAFSLNIILNAVFIFGLFAREAWAWAWPSPPPPPAWQSWLHALWCPP